MLILMLSMRQINDSIHIITSNKSNQYLYPITSNNQTDSMIISVLISTISYISNS